MVGNEFEIRPEAPPDRDAIDRVHALAFPTDAEARLVDALRRAGKLAHSLVARRDGRVVGHIAFSPVRLAGRDTDPPAMGLAPVAVLPHAQRQGIGSRLIVDGIRACRQSGCRFIVVLGEPHYYGRFGFQPARQFRLDNEYGADDAFMAMELIPNAIPLGGGLVQYSPEFGAL